MEDDCPDLGDALDGLDDLLQDENLFQDLEDLGKVLDELNEDGDGKESSDVGESKRESDFDPDKIPGIEDILYSARTTVPIDELEDGEISEFDEKNELKELKKKKAEIVNKMKKLVKHKIQLTNQRNDLLLQLQSNTQLDKVTTLLKENSQLVKAISNQIFRMNPEIKVLNGKIKELESSIGTETYEGKDQKVEENFTASRKDIENIENFFNRLSDKEAVKNKEEVEKDVKGNVRSAKSKQFENIVINKLISAGEKNMPSKPSSPEPKKDEPVRFGLLATSSKPRRFMSDENKIKMMFEKVCEITEKQAASSVPSGNNTHLVNRGIRGNDLDVNSRSLSSTKISGNSEGNSIDKRLREFRMLSSKNTPKADVNMTDSDQEKRKRQISPIRIDKGRVSPVQSGKGHLQSGGLVNQNKKRKSLAEKDFIEHTLKNKNVTDTGSPVASNISKSLLGRLGPVPAKDTNSTITDSVGGETTDLLSENLYDKRTRTERTSFWCQYCCRSFKYIEVYVAHLESLKHLQAAMLKQNGSQKMHCDVPKDHASIDDSDAWYKGSPSSKANQIAPKIEASSGDLCIAVVGIDTFCTKQQAGHFHSRCFAHAQCLLRDNNRIGYAPDSCSVCMEYLQHCHTSLKCCERIFRIFKAFKKKYGLNFDWNDNSMKDWFFDNYRKIQDSSDTNKRATVSYENYKSQKNKCDSNVVDNISEEKMEDPYSNVVVKQEIDSQNEPSTMNFVSDQMPLTKNTNDECGGSSKFNSESSSDAAERKGPSGTSKSLNIFSALGERQSISSNSLPNSSQKSVI